MALQNFTAFDFTEGAAYASITKNGITFNKAVMSKLNLPRYALLLINRAEQQIAIQDTTLKYPGQYLFTRRPIKRLFR
ncbi:MAG: hypothetical protein IJD85_04495 [Oscillospiraceae bacterium]|nr:hypothetical protein [Oscillospiraceae bacterium]